jgi:peptide/nickel transport system ATP-binding protein
MTVDAAQPDTVSDGEVVLDAEGLTKTFHPRGGRFGGGTLTAVDGVSLQLRRGRILGLVGESGCGKSTVARLLSRVYPVTGGSIRFAGTDVTGRRARRRHAYTRHVQIVLQDPFSSLNAAYTVRHHLFRPLRLHTGLRRKAALEEAAVALLEEVSLSPGEEFLGRYPHELSGGQRQRVSIARALAVDPEVLLADEPVSMLDVSIRLGVLRLLARLAKDRHLALLYITHDIASARYFAEDIAVMYAGQVVELGPAEEVTQRPAHPYTQLLVSAAPDPDRLGEGLKASAAGGEPPNLMHPPSGCRFHPRCPHAMDVCRQEAPPKLDAGADHWASCWLLTERKSA